MFKQIKKYIIQSGKWQILDMSSPALFSIYHVFDNGLFSASHKSSPDFLKFKIAHVIFFRWVCPSDTYSRVMLVRYSLLSVCLRLSLFSQLYFMQCMGLCLFSLPISHVDCDNMCTLAKNLHHYHQIRRINHYTLLRVRSWNSGTRYVSYYDLAIELVMCMHLMMTSCHVNIFMKMHTKMSSEKWWLFLNLHDCLFLIMGILVPSPHGDSGTYFSIEILLYQWRDSLYKKHCCMTLLSL